MAARENQGYLIAIIILVLLSLVLALVAFLGFSKMSEYKDMQTAAENKLLLADKLSEAHEIESNIYKAFIGDLGKSPSDIDTYMGLINSLTATQGLETSQRELLNAVYKSVQEAKAKYDKDMLANAASSDDADAANATYKSYIANLTAVLGKTHSTLNIKERQAVLAQQDAEKQIKEKQAQVVLLEQAVKTAQEDLRKEKEASMAKLRELSASLEQNAKALEAANAELQKVKLASQGKVATLEADIAKLTRQNQLLKTKINHYEREDFDRPDGRIVKVASALNSVFLDLGRSDGLTENRSFAIYDQSTTHFEKGQNKASIEIIRVMENQSEGRITQEDPTNPILPGDFVVTATWDPGYAVPMALAGRFDLDHDGVSDTEKLKQMIQRNGGRVVAWHDERGNIQGKIDASVRYLVLGERPSLGRSANPAVERAMDKMQEEAEKNTVQVIDLQKLLNKMGVRAKPKIENLRPERSFQPRSPSGSLKSSTR